LPRTAGRIGLTATVSEPSPGTPLGSRRVLLRPHSPTTAFHTLRTRATASCHWLAANRPRPSLRLTKHSALTSTSSTKRGTGLPNPEAAVAPALASVFDPEVTSLRRFTARSARVCAVSRQAILSRCNASDFPIRNQKLGVPLPHGCSQFGTVSSESHWQALPHVFGCAFRG